MKTAIYIRVSTEDQAKEGYSLEVQREYLESFAEREGHPYRFVTRRFVASNQGTGMGANLNIGIDIS